MNPLVSIVIPTYNRVHELERALRSVFLQSYINWEVIVVDNHSIDDTDKMIEALNDSRVSVLKIHNNGVIAASRNLGIKNSNGKYIAFLDSDDWWLPNKLEESVKYLEKGCDVIYHDLYLVRKHHQKHFFKKTNSRKLITPVFTDLLLRGNALSNSSVVINRKILVEMRYLSESKELIAAEDYDGWLRAARITDKFVKIPTTLGYYWIGGGNTSGLIRTIKVSEKIESIYGKEIRDAGSYYHDYVKGRAYYLLGEFDEAKKYLGIVSLHKFLPFKLKIKLMQFLIMLKSP